MDKANKDNAWWDVICKEVRNVQPALEVWDRLKSEISVSYQRIRCHLIFNVNMREDFQRKACSVAGGHTTAPPAAIMYARVVSCDSVRIAMFIAALNDLEVM